MNVTAFEVPLAVVIVICADVSPVLGGTVTVHVFWAGQLVGATCPLNVAVICPFELRKFAPAIWMPCPAAPDAGVTDEMTGGPPATDGGAGTVVEVPELPRRPEWRGAVAWCVPPCVVAVVEATVGGGAAVGGPLPPGETAKAIPAATTNAATTATETTSQRSRRRAGSVSAWTGSHCVGGPTHSAEGPGSHELSCGGSDAGGVVEGRGVMGGATSWAATAAPPLGTVGAVPDRSRARRTAVSIAPSARRLGVPRGGSAAVPSDMSFLRLGSSFPRSLSKYSLPGAARKRFGPSGV